MATMPEPKAMAHAGVAVFAMEIDAPHHLVGS